MITSTWNTDIEAHMVQVINPPVAHAQCNRWIIFSDLHVRSASIDICEEVLRNVHDEALKRNVTLSISLLYFIVILV